MCLGLFLSLITFQILASPSLTDQGSAGRRLVYMWYKKHGPFVDVYRTVGCRVVGLEELLLHWSLSSIKWMYVFSYIISNTRSCVSKDVLRIWTPADVLEGHGVPYIYFTFSARSVRSETEWASQHWVLRENAGRWITTKFAIRKEEFEKRRGIPSVLIAVMSWSAHECKIPKKSCLSDGLIGLTSEIEYHRFVSEWKRSSLTFPQQFQECLLNR